MTLAAAAVRPNAEKPLRTAPVVTADNEPEGTTAVPVTPATETGSSGPTPRSFVPVVLDSVVPAGW